MASYFLVSKRGRKIIPCRKYFMCISMHLLVNVVWVLTLNTKFVNATIHLRLNYNWFRISLLFIFIYDQAGNQSLCRTNQLCKTKHKWQFYKHPSGILTARLTDVLICRRADVQTCWRTDVQTCRQTRRLDQQI